MSFLYHIIEKFTLLLEISQQQTFAFLRSFKVEKNLMSRLKKKVVYLLKKRKFCVAKKTLYKNREIKWSRTFSIKLTVKPNWNASKKPSTSIQSCQ